MVETFATGFLSPTDHDIYKISPKRFLQQTSFAAIASQQNEYLRMCFKVFSLFKYLMFSRMAEGVPSSLDMCFSSHSTTAWLLSQR